MKRDRVIDSFVNKFGQTIKPGDKVIVVATCSHQVGLYVGEYVGYILQRDYNYRTRKYEQVPAVQVKKIISYNEYFYTGTEKVVSWRDLRHLKDDQYEQRTLEKTKIVTLKNNLIIPYVPSDISNQIINLVNS